MDTQWPGIQEAGAQGTGAPESENFQLRLITPDSNLSPVITSKKEIQNFLQLLAAKDSSTLLHSKRVFELTKEWCQQMKKHWRWTDLDSETLELSALLHDIGKIGVLDELLAKPDYLNVIEREMLEQHSEIGYQLLRDFPGLAHLATGIRHHHERWDGMGYPLGLFEKQIPLHSQIISVVDTYDAITSDRPYREKRSHREALKEIQTETGRQFNPELVDFFLQFMHARNT